MLLCTSAFHYVLFEAAATYYFNIRHYSTYVSSTIYITYLLLQDGWSALIQASQNGHFDVVDTLLQRGASVDLQNTVSVII